MQCSQGGLKIWQILPQEITLGQLDFCFSLKDWGKFLVLGPLCSRPGRFNVSAGMYLASFGHYILTFSAFRALRGSKVWPDFDTWKSWVAGFKDLHPSEKRRDPHALREFSSSRAPSSCNSKNKATLQEPKPLSLVSCLHTFLEMTLFVNAFHQVNALAIFQ